MSIELIVKMTTLTTTYSISVIFELPEGVVLLPPDINAKAPEGTPFSWYIKWKTLNYIDFAGNVQEVEGEDATDWKYHDKNTEIYRKQTDHKVIWRND
jgi:hypothetical protein